jgi:uncharacterized membrane protein HdeD (DUF308 family)
MEQAMTRGRGASAVRGILALAFGVVALAWPGITLGILFMALGVYYIADGVFTIGTAVSSSDRERTGLSVLEGLLSIVIGAYVLFEPASATRLAFICVGLWAIFTGVMQILEAPRLREERANETVMGVSGILRVLVGVVLLARPHAGLTALIVLLALYAFVEGILMLGLAFWGTPRAPATPQPA